MGFWPFGRDPVDIEIVSRVVTAATLNGFRIRGKLTIHFEEPQRQANADEAADRCAALAMALLRDATDHGQIIGAEARLSADLVARYPSELAKARAVELAALHVVGDPALSDELRRASNTGSMAPMTAKPQPATSIANAIASAIPPAGPADGASARPPSPSWPHETRAPNLTPSGGMPGIRRRSSGQMRSIQALLMPPGTSPSGMGQFVGPLVRDSAARLLIGFLRAHDLIAVRRAPVDEASGETLASLVPVSDAPPGGYEASRAGEIARWESVLGPRAIASLRRGSRALSAHLMKEALLRAELMPALVDAVTDAVCASAFPDEPGIRGELVRFPSTAPHPGEQTDPRSPPRFVHAMAEWLSRIAGAGDDPSSMAFALAPLVATVQDDLAIAALIIKQSSGG